MKFKKKISVIGLGYVGLPLANRLSKYYNVVGFDTNTSRIQELKAGIDRNNDVDQKILVKSKIFFTQNIEETKKSDFFIVTVPTPVDQRKKPNLKSINSACKLVAPNLKKGSIVIFESTVYPGLTEEICKPILENYSKLSSPTDFGIGYSPERINPGDKVHTIEKISKIVSGQTNSICNKIYLVYNKIIKAKVYKASSIKIAESAKIIENAQRDLNIAYMNELSIIFNKMNIDTNEVISLASTKWNFLNFKPGLVGGHCISVDPYYLTYKSKKVGYHPKFILSGREINDNMPNYIVSKIKAKNRNKKIKKINFFGITFKENCSDFRNSLSLKMYELLRKNFKIDLHDPYYEGKFLNKNTFVKKFKDMGKADLNIISVSHEFYIKKKKYFMNNIFKKKSIIFDLKSIYSKREQKFFKLDLWQL